MSAWHMRFPLRSITHLHQHGRADRLVESALHHSTRPLSEALHAEFVGGEAVLEEEAWSGARRFAAGEGRHGRFNGTSEDDGG